MRGSWGKLVEVGVGGELHYLRTEGECSHRSRRTEGAGRSVEYTHSRRTHVRVQLS